MKTVNESENPEITYQNIVHEMLDYIAQRAYDVLVEEGYPKSDKLPLLNALIKFGEPQEASKRYKNALNILMQTYTVRQKLQEKNVNPYYVFDFAGVFFHLLFEADLAIEFPNLMRGKTVIQGAKDGGKAKGESRIYQTRNAAIRQMGKELHSKYPAWERPQIAEEIRKNFPWEDYEPVNALSSKRIRDLLPKY